MEEFRGNGNFPKRKEVDIGALLENDQKLIKRTSFSNKTRGQY